MLILILLIVSGIKRNNQDNRIFNDFFDKKSCNCLKGACAIYIMLGHYYMRVPFVGLNAILRPVQPVVVLLNGLFFFISGYGLMKNVQIRTRYLSWKSFLQRIFNLASVAYISYFLSALFFDIDSVNELVRHLLGLNLFKWLYFNDPTWFLIELVILYTLFWVLYSYTYKKNTSNKIFTNILLIAFILIWYLVAIHASRGTVWYASTLCFPLGIIIAQNDSYIFKCIKKHCLMTICFIGCICACVLYNILVERSIIGSILCNIASVLFCVGAFFFVCSYGVYNKILEWLGEISFEIYLLNIYAIEYTKSRLEPSCALWTSIISTLILATVVHWAVISIKRCCNKLRVSI